MVQQGQLDLQQIQADELRIKTQRGVVWMALAIMVSIVARRGGEPKPRQDPGAADRDAGVWDVSGRLSVQLLHLASESASWALCDRPRVGGAALGGAHACDGGWLD